MSKVTPRYFYIAYNYKANLGFGFGSVGRICADGKMFNLDEWKESISKDPDVTNPIIMSIQEMNEEDFYRFFSLTKKETDFLTNT